MKNGVFKLKIEDFRDITYEKEENGICTLTFNRPERKNALSFLTFLEIYTVLDDMEKDRNTKVLIMTGCKEANAYSSGGYFNLKFLDEIPPEIKKELNIMDIAQKKLCMKFWNFTKPVIAAINGLAVGAGITMSLVGADLIYMSEDAWLGFYFVKRAAIPEFGMNFILPFYLGFQKTKEIIYFGDKITAQQAYEMGLGINKVLPPDELMPYTRDIALRLIPPKGPSLSIKLMKKTMHSYFKDILERTLDLENRGLRKAMTSYDLKESMRALKEKRDSIFEGH